MVSVVEEAWLYILIKVQHLAQQTQNCPSSQTVNYIVKQLNCLKTV